MQDEDPVLSVLASFAMGGDSQHNDSQDEEDHLFFDQADWGIDLDDEPSGLSMDSTTGLRGSRSSSMNNEDLRNLSAFPLSPRLALSGYVPMKYSTGVVLQSVPNDTETSIFANAVEDETSGEKKAGISGDKKKNLKRKRQESTSSVANSDVRLQRNRESAKQYRLRKKQEIAALESTRDNLENQNEHLRKEIAAAQALQQMVNVQNNEEFEKRMHKLKELVSNNATDEDILQQLYRLRIDYHARSARLNYHLKKIQKLMQPLPIEEVCVSCSYGSTNPGSQALIRSLRKTLRVDSQATEMLARFRVKTLELHERRKRTQELCVAAGKIAIEELKQMDEFFVNLPSTLYTPRQAARFMQFIHENKALGIVINSNIEKLIPSPNDLPQKVSE